MSRQVVWIVPQIFNNLHGEFGDLEVVVTPDDPANSPQLHEVVMAVTPMNGGSLAPLFGKMQSLQVIHTTSAGVDAILPFVPDGVTLCSAKGSFTAPVAEWVMAAILSDYKRLSDFRDLQREGVWNKSSVRMLRGSKVLFVGYGEIAQGVEERLLPFGVEVTRIARSPRPGVSELLHLAEELPLADIVVLLVPLTPETKGMIGTTELSLMKPGSLLVNAARGPVVNTDALIEAVASGHIRAVVDVTDPEPLPDGHPLFGLTDVLVTPHIAGGLEAAMSEVVELIGEQIGKLAAGEPLKNTVSHGY